MNEHTGLIARLAREYRMSSAVENDLERLAQKGATASQLTAHAAATAAEAEESKRLNFPPAHQQPAAPTSYSPNEAPEVRWGEENTDPPSFATFGNREVPLPPLP
jgi:hypothetical protein